MSMRFSSRIIGSVASVVGPLAFLAVTPVAAHADAGLDHLTITVADSDNGSDGTYELECSPAGGTHSDPGAACGRLDELETQGVDPFAPVAGDARCTMQYGGQATARVTGTWHGRVVDSSYTLGNGCEIARWQQLEPVLPATGP
ncbi:SSI family serine proteinase inhibitor [Streptomyces endophyticus]|uniref:Subtilase-type protease inhibitor n=1 Tax=Streptomyces endophyticus TaxID=714166 RepID=A0ABU6FJV6_9ACTN|nr:SSI family serine proteinase inhibitor [Streptomyces endophyticus]MEB8343877.1 subtilase-type protease inhibitor [Streptomyces endophyticus]